jgi:phospholipid transport system substrate-binding protein
MPIPRPAVTILTLALSTALALPAVAGDSAPAATPVKTKTAAKTTKATKVPTTVDKKGEAAPAAKAPTVAASAVAPTPAVDKVSATPPTTSPMAELKKSNSDLDKILKKNVPNWTPEAELQRVEVRKLVGGFLDYAELARRSLARHWDGLTAKQREDFSNTLRELVERSYLKQLHGGNGGGYNIKYDKEEKTGNEALVDATLHTTSRGKKVEVALQYKMLGKNGHWVVYDVLTDEQSMLENYRAEFNKIIQKDGFDALMKRMKKKLDEKEE